MVCLGFGVLVLFFVKNTYQNKYTTSQNAKGLSKETSPLSSTSQIYYSLESYTDLLKYQSIVPIPDHLNQNIWRYHIVESFLSYSNVYSQWRNIVVRKSKPSMLLLLHIEFLSIIVWKVFILFSQPANNQESKTNRTLHY